MTENKRLFLLGSLVPLFLISSVWNTYTFLLFSSSISVCVYLLCLIAIVINKQYYRYLLISGLFSGFWISLGFIQSFSSGNFSFLSNDEFAAIFYNSSIKITPGLFSLAVAYMCTYVFVLNFISNFNIVRRAEYRFDGYLKIILKSLPSSYLRLGLFAFSLILTYISLSGLFVVRGFAGKESSSGLPWWFVFGNLAIGLVPILIGLVISRSRHNLKINFFDKLITFYTFAIGVYFSVLQGRKSLYTFFISSLFAWLLIERPNITLSRSFIFKILFAISSFLILLPFVFKTFAYVNVLRSANFAVNPASLLTNYLSFISTESVLSAALEKTTQNLVSRPLVLKPLAQVIHMYLEGTYQGLIGFQDLINSFLNSLPSFIFPFKSSLILQENLLYRYFPVGNTDTADSPFLFSFASFGVLGLIIYPSAMALMYTFCFNYVGLVNKCPWPHYVVSIYLLFVASQALYISIRSFAEIATTGLYRIVTVVMILGLPLVLSRRSRFVV
ncbi:MULTISPECIES: hypothetical protein [unclassified Synechococcus]|uniref:hypothetical protein n=1 Tax=unclassified Synechococcus TaxID=2626047 RepID=UPI0039B092FD